MVGVGETQGEASVAGEHGRDAQMCRQGLDRAGLIGHSKTFRFYSNVRGSHGRVFSTDVA